MTDIEERFAGNGDDGGFDRALGVSASCPVEALRRWEGAESTVAVYATVMDPPQQ